MTTMIAPAPLRPSARRGFTLMEMLVAIGIAVVLAALVIPGYSMFVTKGHQAVALTNLRSLATAFGQFTSENAGRLPLEDAPGSDSWSAAANATNDKVWYNALPRLLGQKGVGDYAASPRQFYTKANVLYLPGARYPADRKLAEPLFAFAMNSRLQRKAIKAIKDEVRITEISEPSRTVLFFEQGLKGEKNSGGIGVQGRFDGSPKGTARSFVGRYNRKGVVSFVDGHAELFSPSDLLSETGALPFPQRDLIWTANPDADPN